MRNLSPKFLNASLWIALFAGVVLKATPVLAAPPVLLFSDLTSGPATGLGDGKGSGAIVTVWGTNLGVPAVVNGVPQSGFSVQVGGVPAAYVYYWKNADGTLPGGPAELFKYQRMQEIAFSVPAAAIGVATISVTVGGIASNGLQFAVKQGRFFFVKGTGNNSNSGSWSQPWKTMVYAVGALPNHVPGDIIYVADNLTEWLDIGQGNNINGAAGNPIAVVVYPGFRAIGEQPNQAPYCSGGPGIWAHGSGTPVGPTGIAISIQYWVVSKFVAHSCGGGFDGGNNFKYVGIEGTQTPGSCGTGQGGAIGASSYKAQLTLYGIYIHDAGCQASSTAYHLIYLSYNDGGLFYTPYEVGWNHYENNLSANAFQFYTEGLCGNFTGTALIHDNVIVNQRGLAINTGDGCNNGVTIPSTTVYKIYNNLLINVGKLSDYDRTNHLGYPYAIGFQGAANQATFYLYNNTVYGYGDSNNPNNTPTYAVTSGASNPFGGTVYYQNNLIFDTLNYPFFEPGSSTMLASHANNLWYSNFGQPVPAWDTGPITSNPLFVDAANGLFNLQLGSPAIGAGYNTAPIVVADILGAPRTVPYSIGAFQFQNAAATAPAPPRGFVLK